MPRKKDVGPMERFMRAVTEYAAASAEIDSAIENEQLSAAESVAYELLKGRMSGTGGTPSPTPVVISAKNKAI